jgi:hypothetical protein
MLPLPPIAEEPIATDDVLYEWDEWRVRDYFDFDEPDLEDQLDEVSGRGSLALTLAVGEWICERFSRLSADAAPLQFLEAGWAEQMQPGLTDYYETNDDDWRGPVRGPLSMVITIANDALFCLDEDDAMPGRAAWMTNLARHVLPVREGFETWLAAVVQRLLEHHPAANAADESLPGDEFELGRPVARQLFDTTRPWFRADEAPLVKDFIQRVDPSNPFLLANT